MSDSQVPQPQQTPPSPPFAQQDILKLMLPGDPPCLSLYMPTHRRFPENRQDPIRFKNLLKTLEDSLRQQDSVKSHALLEPFQALLGDAAFWNHAWDGLAVFSRSGLFQTVKLQQSVPELAIVANSFHVKPLLRIVQSSSRFQALALNRREIRLFEGDRSHLDEVQLAPGVPATISEALGEDLTEPHQTVASYGGTRLGSNMRHSHGSRKDELDSDDERFFRVVGRAVLERHSKPSKLPLVLVALPQYQTPFRELSRNPFLLANGVETDPAALSADELREGAWGVIEPQLHARIRQLAESFGTARANGLGSEDLTQAAAAAAQSRVATLLLEQDRRTPGHIDPASGAVTLGSLQDPETDDALDDLAELVLARGGEVFVAPTADMPSQTGLAATLRF